MSDEAPLARWLTVPGRLLALFTILAGAAVFVWYFLSTIPDLPAGRYPVFMWLVPVALGGFVFFLLAAWTLEKLGVRIYRR
jgi:hypothetical protein